MQLKLAFCVGDLLRHHTGGDPHWVNCLIRDGVILSSLVKQDGWLREHVFVFLGLLKKGPLLEASPISENLFFAILVENACIFLKMQENVCIFLKMHTFSLKSKKMHAFSWKCAHFP